MGDPIANEKFFYSSLHGIEARLKRQGRSKFGTPLGRLLRVIQKLLRCHQLRKRRHVLQSRVG
jgi:hypothetical protein